MKKTIRLTESDLKIMVKKIIKEINYKQLGKGIVAATAIGAISYVIFVHPNKIYITTKNGEEISAEKGDTFVGVVKNYRPTGYKRVSGMVVQMETSNGDEVEFYTTQPIEFNVGDTIKVQAGSAFRMFDKGSDYEKY